MNSTHHYYNTPANRVVMVVYTQKYRGEKAKNIMLVLICKSDPSVICGEYIQSRDKINVMENIWLDILFYSYNFVLFSVTWDHLSSFHKCESIKDKSQKSI